MSEIPCQECGGGVVEFSVPNDVWNEIMRPDGKEHDREYLCVGCFAKHAVTASNSRVFNAVSKALQEMEESPASASAPAFNLGRQSAVDWVRRALRHEVDRFSPNPSPSPSTGPEPLLRPR